MSANYTWPNSYNTGSTNTKPICCSGNGKYIYVAVYNGPIYISNNYGISWTQVLNIYTYNNRIIRTTYYGRST